MANIHDDLDALISEAVDPSEVARLRAALADMAECDTWPVFSHRVVISKALSAVAVQEPEA